jgi:hypothetical protein
LGIGIIASTWLWGVAFGKQRLRASSVRLSVVRGAAGLVSVAATALFFLRDRWPPPIGVQAGTIFIALVLTLAALLYALLPPQRDL